LGVILQRDALDLAAAGGEEHRHHVVLHDEFFGLRLAGRRQRLAQRLHLTLAYRCRSLCGRHFGLHAVTRRQRIGHGSRRTRGCGHRIDIGLVCGFLFQILFLLLAVEIGESQKKNRYDGNAYD